MSAPGLHPRDSGAGKREGSRPLALGEVLWDVFPDSTRLGGAPLNFAAHARKLGHDPSLISAVGDDDPGRRALEAIGSLGLSTALVQTTGRFPTGQARVEPGPGGQVSFRIERPAAYDDVTLSPRQFQAIRARFPDWFYFGTLFPSAAEGRAILFELLRLLPDAVRFYDLNLRPGFDSLTLVCELLQEANVAKMNQDEMLVLSRHFALPAEPRAFCAAASERFGLRGVCVTLGPGGCAVFVDGEYAEDAGCRIDVADTVGAGDAFAAAFLHGLASRWDIPKIARFANRVGALVASKPGAIPDWTPAEAAALR